MGVEQLIRRYRLEPHPEGGWYREVHRSDERVSRGDGEQRSGLTAILFLLPQGEISRWHRVSRADETWHHAGGAPMELLCLPPGGGELRRQRLASLGVRMPGDRAAQLGDGQPGGWSAPTAAPAQAESLEQSEPLAIVPAGWWQAARSLGAWSLVSCCVGPGFDFADFSLLRDLPEPEWPAGALAAFL